MKVVHLGSGYAPHPVGAWVATHRFLRYVAARDHDVVAVSRRAGTRPHTLEGVQVVSGCNRKAADSHLADADVVTFALADRVAARILTDHPTPVVGLAHGDIVIDQATIDATADLVIFNSHALQASVAHSVPSIVCHPPVDPADHRTAPGEHVTIANTSRAKGIDTAWRISERQSARRYLAVDACYQPDSRRIPRGPQWTIRPPTRDMRTVWSDTRILLMPSVREAWGMVGIEAMCSGIPVIAHPTPGLRESLGDAGIFCDRNDIAAWCAALDRLDDPTEFALAAKKARARVDQLDPQADLDRFADTLEGIA